MANEADPRDLNRYSYVHNNPLNRIDPTGHCVNNQRETTRNDPFDCSLDELRDLEWNVRIWWTDELGKASKLGDWLTNLKEVMEVFRDNAAFSDLRGWASTANAANLQVIQDGYRSFMSRSRTTSGSATDEGVARWHEVVGAVNFAPHRDVRQMLARAESLSAGYGIAVADATVGRGTGDQRAQIDRMVWLVESYRALMDISPYTPAVIGAAAGGLAGGGVGYIRCGALCAAAGTGAGAVAGFGAVNWAADPRATMGCFTPTYSIASAVAALHFTRCG